MNNKKIHGLLGLARSANKISFGEQVLSDIRSNVCKLVIISNDASENTKKKITDKAKYYNCKVVFYDEIAMCNAVGKYNIKYLAINDEGFAEKIYQLLKG